MVCGAWSALLRRWFRLSRMPRNVTGGLDPLLAGMDGARKDARGPERRVWGYLVGAHLTSELQKERAKGRGGVAPANQGLHLGVAEEEGQGPCRHPSTRLKAHAAG